ncbi:hypothetical protein AMAG_18613, partial [Allomyces macrogynus ATCC 38327]
MVAYYNFNRIRFEFNQFFPIILEHFVEVVQLDDDIATFAVDSLRQLTSKFLERDELAHFNSQLDSAEPSPLTIRCRLLALELLMTMLNQLSQAKCPVVADILTSQGGDLCVAISKNATSSHAGLFENSLSLFSLILTQHRHLFKPQIPVLLCDVYLPVLAGNATLQHKQHLLQSLALWCTQPQTLVDLYVNFDCDLHMPSCIEDLLHRCCQAYATQPAQALAVLEGVLRSLAGWMVPAHPMSPINGRTSASPLGEDGQPTPSPTELGVGPAESKASEE